ncbi:hypothetical protein WME94_41280 [Sorangium sp. So ce429]
MLNQLRLNALSDRLVLLPVGEGEQVSQIARILSMLVKTAFSHGSAAAPPAMYGRSLGRALRAPDGPWLSGA